MTTYLRFALGSLAFGAAIIARAESTPAHPARNRMVPPILAVLDTNHDGTLSAKEIATAPFALRAFDLNGDGIISADERQALSPDERPMRAWLAATSSNLLLTLDANHDGDIQPMEIANAVSSLKRLDANGDGQLSPDELRPVMVAYHRS